MNNGIDSKVYKLACKFSIKIVKQCRILRDEKEFVLSTQLLKSGTSIGANIAEANGAISMADFSAKISISYKEALETKYWLDLLKDTDTIGLECYDELFRSVDEIAKILYSILKTTRNINPEKKSDIADGDSR
ncbi:MAG: four helix bundle protein [Sedimentisphaeraceae bacterium JB056]